MKLTLPILLSIAGSTCFCSVIIDEVSVDPVISLPLNDDPLSMEGSEIQLDDETRIKRETLKEIMDKLNKKGKISARNSFKLITTDNPKNLLNELKTRLNKIKSSEIVSHKDLQTRLQELRLRMQPIVKSRNKQQEKNNIIEQLKHKQEELKKLIKPAAAKQLIKEDVKMKNRLSLTKKPRMKSRLSENEEKEKETSITTVKTTTTGVPVVASTATATTEHLKDVDQTSPTAIQKIKEKQKETVLKIKDKMANNKEKKEEVAASTVSVVRL